MEAGQVTEAGERADAADAADADAAETESMAASAPHPQLPVPIRHSAPPFSLPSTGALKSSNNNHSSSSSYPALAKDAPRGSDVWAGAISRLQVQVQLNTSMLESNRQKFLELENSMQMLHHEMTGIKTSLRDVQAELRSRSANPDPRRHDPRDLEVLTQQVEHATNKANEVDGLRMQLNLLQNTMRRMEEHASPAVTAMRPGTASTHPQTPSFHEAVPPPPPPISHRTSNPTLHQPLPPMRTASMGSTTESRPASLHGPHSGAHGHAMEHPTSSSYHASPYAGESSAISHPPASIGFRPSEPLPPPSSLTGWRPADPMAAPTSLPPPPPPPPSASVRPPSMEPSTGWATVNAAPSSKRPFEEPRPSPYEPSASGSPKRPKLAPIMPRSNYSDESSYVPSTIPHPSASESPFTSRSRAPSDGSQSQSQIIGTPSSTPASHHRFIVSTQDADSQASWRPDSERMLHMHPRGHAPGPGRGRGRGNRGRARRGRGGAPPHHPEDLPTPEWEKPGWTPTQISSNGFPPHHSPSETARDRETEFPATPLAVQGPYDPFNPNPDTAAAGQTSAGKKTRTKPIRNAEGVLIRKDGRPDMRSVSSANNLRKVHAKKEAERAEMGAGGRTPTSVPAGENAGSEDEGGSPSPESAEGGEDELMRRIYPAVSESRTAAERFFPRDEQGGVGDVKAVSDVEMRESSSGESRRVGEGEDSKMATVEEAVEEEEQEQESEPVASGGREQEQEEVSGGEGVGAGREEGGNN